MTVDRFCLRVVVSAIAFEFAHSILYRMHSREVGSRGRPFWSTAFIAFEDLFAFHTRKGEARAFSLGNAEGREVVARESC